jgi:predicted ester cyclase
MSAQNKAMIERLFEEVWNKGNLAVVDELVASSFVNHANPEAPQGIAGYKQSVTTSRSVWPDWHETIEDMLTEGDKVIVRFTIRGTHKGEMSSPMGTIAATGKQIAASGIVIYRLANGKIVERWGNVDTLGILQQVGAIPAPAATAR